jgi:hypothetical protein
MHKKYVSKPFFIYYEKQQKSCLLTEDQDRRLVRKIVGSHWDIWSTTLLVATENMNVRILEFGFFFFKSAYPFAPGWLAWTIAHFGTFSLWTLDTASPVFSYATCSVSFFEPFCFDLTVQNRIPTHAGSILGTQMDQIRLKIKSHQVKSHFVYTSATSQ